MVTRFLLVCEGNSDAPLAFHIQRLFDSIGYTRPDFHATSDGRRLIDKIQNGLDEYPNCDLLFVHGDADREGPDVRYGEIAEAIRDSDYEGPWVGAVPVRTTEAWLLLDERAIRTAAGNTNGLEPLQLPTPTGAERIPDPKSHLQSILLTAGGVRGRRRRMLLRRIPAMRDRLLENLPVDGPLRQVPSWARFRDDTVAALRELGG